jgi:hypothetical protein
MSTGMHFTKSLLFLIMIVSCNSTNETKIQDDFLAKQLESSNIFITENTSGLLKELANKSSAPEYSKTRIWLNKAESIDQFTKELNIKIDSIENFAKTNTESDLLKSLKRGLEEYQNRIVKVDQKISDQFGKDILNLTQIDSLSNLGASLKNKLPDKKTLLFNAIRNKIFILENQIITFCSFQTAYDCILHFDKFSILIGQNSLHFKKGDELKIFVGVGAYSVSSQADIQIDNHRIEANENGISNFKMKINNKPGKYKIPIKVDYYNESGELKSTMNFAEYFVE